MKAFRRRPGPLYAMLSLVLGVLAAALAIHHALPDDSATRATVSQALHQFRHAQKESSRRKKATGLPAPGVYRYRTHGQEEFNGLLSASHSYNGVSSVVVTPHSCGISERWQVLSERWTASVACLDGSRVNFVQLNEHHEFFGTATETFYQCTQLARRYVARCTSAGNLLLNRSRMIGIESIQVGGRRFEAMHRRSTITFSGEMNGRAKSDEWRRRSDELLLKKRFNSAAKVDAGGGGTYRERYGLSLVSPHPRR